MDATAVPTAKDVKDTAGVIFLMMKDQRTNDSFGTFHAWLTAEHPTVTTMGVRNMWLHCFREHGAMNDDQLAGFWERYRLIRRDTEQRKGQALMNALPEYLGNVVTGTGADCFHDDFAIGALLEFLGIPRYSAAVKVPEQIDEAGSPIYRGLGS